MEEYEQQVQRKKNYCKQYYIDNKERLNTKGKEYYSNNKDRLKKESLEVVQCPLCGTCLRKSSLSHHKRTEKCKELRAMRIIYNTLNK